MNVRVVFSCEIPHACGMSSILVKVIGLSFVVDGCCHSHP